MSPSSSPCASVVVVVPFVCAITTVVVAIVFGASGTRAVAAGLEVRLRLALESRQQTHVWCVERDPQSLPGARALLESGCKTRRGGVRAEDKRWTGKKGPRELEGTQKSTRD